MNLVRRKLLGGTLGAATLGLLGGIGGMLGGMSKAFATPEDVADAIKDYAGDAEVGTGTITLTTPEIAENGNSVPISISVDSPMTEDDYVESVVVYADGNPLPQVVTFNFSPASGEECQSNHRRLRRLEQQETHHHGKTTCKSSKKSGGWRYHHHQNAGKSHNGIRSTQRQGR